MAYIYTGVPNTTFEDIEEGDKFYDLRNLVGFGALVVTEKNDDADAVRSWVQADNLVTGQTHRIPKRDFWAYKI